MSIHRFIIESLALFSLFAMLYVWSIVGSALQS